MPKGHDGTTALPTLYVIGGFPGALGSAGLVPWLYGPQADADQIAIVYLEAEYHGGHSVFADSPAGGPWGTALVTELLPALEAAFPLRSDRDGRFLTGHSSGGWASLWLALEHPKIFGGTVSTSPDPVDFTRFQTVDIYAPGANIYTSMDGTDAPVARRNDRAMATARNFIAMERVMGEGGQMRSFEWTFSPRGDDGLPVALWDQTTGDIDPAVAEHWRRYDIADRIRREWDVLEPVLRDRVLIIMGESDTFYLDAAARSLDAELTARGLPNVVELIPGDHSSILTPAVAKRTLARLVEQMKNATQGDQPTQP
jgi:S-formylglutathione hydrolase FrmB